jgi:hypothetical protein
MPSTPDLNDFISWPKAALGNPTWNKPAWVQAQSAVAASVTGTLTETVLATIAIPAGAMGVNGVIRVTTVWTVTNSADSKVLKTVLGGAVFNNFGVTTTVSVHNYCEVRNRGVVNSQVAYQQNGTGTASSGNALLAVDTSVAQNLTITGTIGANAGSNTITLEGYTVEILNP